jgi:predicted Zn-dependent peptidase
VYCLPDDTFNTFVTKMQQVTAAEVRAAAATHLHPTQLVTVVVGDPQCRESLAPLGMPVETLTPEW